VSAFSDISSACRGRCAIVSTWVVHLPRLPVRLLSADELGEPSSSVRLRVEAARERQLTRYVGARSPYNSALDNRRLRELGAPTADALDLLAGAAERFRLSPRAHDASSASPAP
jgi:magnesium chelatase family protein